MDLQFSQSVHKYLQCAAREYQSQEQTQEIRIPDGMPDMAVVLACWGQPILRGKEWRSDHVGVTGGVMAKVMYIPEDAGPPQVVEAWLPFQMKWNIPTDRPDGTMLVDLGLRSADARVLTARKLMVRTNVGVRLHALCPAEYTVFQPESVPDDIQLLTNRQLLTLPVEAGEKAFGLDEILEISGAGAKLAQVIRLSLLPQVLEQKVLSDKLIFRGLCIAHLLYRAEDGQLYSKDFDVPFSQYADLSGEYGADASMQVVPAITNLEFDQTPERALHLKAGLSGQYLIFEQAGVDLIQDAYSPVRSVEAVMNQLQVPAVLDQTTQPISAQTDPQVDVMRAVDVEFWPEQPYISSDGRGLQTDLGGMFQMLYYDPDGQLQSTQTRWEQTQPLSADTDADAAVTLRPGGKAGYSTGMLHADLLTDTTVTARQGMDMVSALTVGEPAQPSPDRPSLVVTKAGKDTLWQIAKANATTVDLIRKANHLESEPTPDTVLLIPM